jgi:hypothetical protein
VCVRVQIFHENYGSGHTCIHAHRMSGPSMEFMAGVTHAHLHNTYIHNIHTHRMSGSSMEIMAGVTHAYVHNTYIHIYSHIHAQNERLLDGDHG